MTPSKMLEYLAQMTTAGRVPNGDHGPRGLVSTFPGAELSTQPEHRAPGWISGLSLASGALSAATVWAVLAQVARLIA